LPAREYDRRLLNEAVRAAGAAALSYYGKPVKTWRKPNDSPVSEADVEVDHLLKEMLSNVRPDYGWLSEETTDTPDRLERDRVWVIDPIDGTRAFLQGKPHWTISAALIEHNRPVLAAVFNPVEEEFFEAEIDRGALLNGTRLKVSGRTELEGCRMIAHDWVFKRDIWQTSWPAMQVAMRNSMAYRLCLIAQAAFDAAITISAKSDWDLAAADLIIAEAGGKLTTSEDRPLRYNQAHSRHRPIIASGNKLYPHLHRQMAGLNRN
jgi:myo-inositol-1(or 4)-monophosphatase